MSSSLHNVVAQCWGSIVPIMSWLNVVGALIAFKHEEVYGKLSDGKRHDQRYECFI